MADEPIQSVEQAQETPPAEAPEAPAEQPEAPAWATALKDAPADELRKHDRIAGIVGDEIKKRQDAWEAAQRAKIADEERAKVEQEIEQAEQELDDLYNQNPLAYADKVQNQRLVERQQKRLAKLKNDAVQLVSQRFGAAYQALPEFKQLVEDPQEFAVLMQAIQGKSDDEVPIAWHAAVSDGVAKLRARNLAEAQLQERLTKERAAWQEEAAAAGLATSARPDLRRGSRTASLDPEPDYRNTAQWNAWYARTTPGAKKR